MKAEEKSQPSQSSNSQSQSQSSSSSGQSSSSSGQSTATRPAEPDDYDLLDSQDDPIWAILASIKRKKFQTYQLLEESHSFGRDPSNDFMFHKRIHGLDRIEFENISKHHFVIQKDGTAATITDRSMNGTYLNSVKLPKGRPVPIPHLSVVSLAQPHNKCFQFYNRCHQKQQLELVPSGFFASYTLEDIVLGSGSTAVIKKGFRNSDYNEKIAVKIINKMNKNFRSDKDFAYEVNLIKDLEYHRNIIQSFELFQNSHFVYIVMEYANSGDSLLYIQKHGPLSESTAKDWFSQIVDAVKFLHDHHIIHRDIKPQNVLLSRSTDRRITPKLADFGYSRFVDMQSLCKTYAGTPFYWAPEVTNSLRGYSKEADLWSLGCLLYVFVVGEHAFVGKVVVPAAVQQIMQHQKIERMALVKNLLLSLLVFNPKKRLKIEDIFTHRWFNEDTNAHHSPPTKRQKVV